MAAFKVMNPDDIRKLIEGHTSVLEPLIKKEEAFFRNSICPVCQSNKHTSKVNSRNPFTNGSPLPNKILECQECSSEWDPYSGFVYRVRNESA